MCARTVWSICRPTEPVLGPYAFGFGRSGPLSVSCDRQSARVTYSFSMLCWRCLKSVLPHTTEAIGRGRAPVRNEANRGFWQTTEKPD